MPTGADDDQFSIGGIDMEALAEYEEYWDSQEDSVLDEIMESIMEDRYREAHAIG